MAACKKSWCQNAQGIQHLEQRRGKLCFSCLLLHHIWRWPSTDLFPSCIMEQGMLEVVCVRGTSLAQTSVPGKLPVPKTAGTACPTWGLGVWRTVREPNLQCAFDLERQKYLGNKSRDFVQWSLCHEQEPVLMGTGIRSHVGAVAPLKSEAWGMWGLCIQSSAKLFSLSVPLSTSLSQNQCRYKDSA